MTGRGTVREEKIKVVSAVREIADKSSAIILTNYRGMTVKQITELRRTLRSASSQYKVVKNTLSIRALPQNADLLKKLADPIAILFISGDPVAPAKQLFGFISENEKPEVICGLVDQKFFNKEEVVKLSKLPSRQELIAKLLGTLNSPLFGMVNVLAGNIRKFVCVLNAIKEVKSSGKS